MPLKCFGVLVPDNTMRGQGHNAFLMNDTITKAWSKRGGQTRGDNTHEGGKTYPLMWSTHHQRYGLDLSSNIRLHLLKDSALMILVSSSAPGVWPLMRETISQMQGHTSTWLYVYPSPHSWPWKRWDLLTCQKPSSKGDLVMIHPLVWLSYPSVCDDNKLDVWRR